MTPNQQLQEMIDRYEPRIAAIARGALARLRRLMPGAVQLVYDNAYALVVGFSATDRASEAVLSVAIFPKKVGLCFIWGADLPDPDGLLQGDGKQVRHIRVNAAAELDRPAVKRLIRVAIAASESPFAKRGATMQIRAISGKRRARRPVPKR